MNNQKLLPMCFFLLLVFINKKNTYGFLLLLSSVVLYFKNPKLALISLFLWTILILKSNYNEYFTTTTSSPSALTTVSPQQWTSSDDENKVRLFAHFKNDSLKNTYNLEMNNTFNDLKRLFGNSNNKDLSVYAPSLNIISENGDAIIHIIDNDNLTFNSWNEFAKNENKQAQEHVANFGDSELNDTDKKMQLRVKFPLPLIKDNLNIIFVKLTNVDKLIYLFKNLTLVFDNQSILNILSLKKIDNPYDLAFITGQHFEKDGILSTINQPSLKNLRNFGFIFRIPGFEENRTIQLIKKNPDMEITSKEKTIEYLETKLKFLNAYEKEGLNFYKGIRKINSKYYDILDLLEINKLYGVESVKEIVNNDLYSDIEIKKNLNYIALIFSIKNILTNVELSDKTDSWKLRVLKRIAEEYSTLFENDDEIFNQFELKARITNKLYDKKIELDKSFDLDIDIINLSNKLNQTKKFKNKNYEAEIEKQKSVEYETIQKLNNSVNTYEQQRNVNSEMIELDKIERMLSHVCLDIVNELTDLFTNYEDETFANYIGNKGIDDDEPNKLMLHKYIYTFKQIVIILTKEGRMFYVGILIFIVAILVYFIESSK